MPCVRRAVWETLLVPHTADCCAPVSPWADDAVANTFCAASPWQPGKICLLPFLFLEYFGSGSTGTGARLGQGAVVSRGCWGGIARGTAEALVMPPVIPGF